MWGYQQLIAVIIVAIETIKYLNACLGKKPNQDFESPSSMSLINSHYKTYNSVIGCEKNKGYV